MSSVRVDIQNKVYTVSWVEVTKSSPLGVITWSRRKYDAAAEYSTTGKLVIDNAGGLSDDRIVDFFNNEVNVNTVYLFVKTVSLCFGLLFRSVVIVI